MIVNAQVEFGTDSGPSCANCASTIWLYRYWPDITSYAVATCRSCGAQADIEWPTTTTAPASVQDMRALHVDLVAHGRATAAIKVLR